MIKGISHITLVVKGLDRSSRFFADIFNAELVYASGGKTHSLSKEVSLMGDGLWIALPGAAFLTGPVMSKFIFGGSAIGSVEYCLSD